MFVSDGTTSRRCRQVSACMARVRGGEYPGGMFGGPAGRLPRSPIGSLVGGSVGGSVGSLVGGSVGGVVGGSVGSGARAGGDRAAGGDPVFGGTVGPVPGDPIGTGQPAGGHLPAGTELRVEGTGQSARDRRRPNRSATGYRPDPARTGPPALRVVVEVVDRVWWWRLSGQLRAGSLAVLEANVDLLGAARCDQVVVDLRELTEVDDVGCKVLLGLHHYMTARGGRLGIAGASPLVARALQAAGMTHVSTNVTLA